MSSPVRAFPWARLALLLWLGSACALVVLSALGHAPSAWLGLGLVLAILATVTLGIFFAQLGLFARPIVAAQPTGDALALTFDDGPDEEATRAVLDLLDARGHRGTFFVIGRKAEAQRALLEELTRRGHAIANHSFEHAHTTPFLPVERLAAELTRAEDLLASVRGARSRWFRAPVGIISPRVAEAAKRAGMELVSWTRSARDGTARATVESAMARLRPRLQPGAILVLHDGAERDDRRPIAPELLRPLLDELERRGLRSVTLDELLA